MNSVRIALWTVFSQLKFCSLVFVLRSIVILVSTLGTFQSYQHSHVVSPFPEKIWWWGEDLNLRRHSASGFTVRPLWPLGHPTTENPVGASGGTRTHNLLITNQSVYRLSYAGPIFSKTFMAAVGLEPTTR